MIDLDGGLVIISLLVIINLEQVILNPGRDYKSRQALLNSGRDHESGQAFLNPGARS